MMLHNSHIISFTLLRSSLDKIFAGKILKIFNENFSEIAFAATQSAMASMECN
jgi:hypothetical protein